jgi:hypothetical protein
MKVRWWVTRKYEREMGPLARKTGHELSCITKRNFRRRCNPSAESATIGQNPTQENGEKEPHPIQRLSILGYFGRGSLCGLAYGKLVQSGRLV